MIGRAPIRFFVLLLAMLSVCVFEATAAELDDPRFEDGWDDGWQERANAVNEGTLHILQPVADLPEHHHHNLLKLTEQSLKTGWVDMYQCHTNLDATSALQIVFAEGRVRDLHIVSQRKIARAWVEKNTVQLEAISPGSRICLSLKTRALSVNNNIVLLRNGPFMRQFLDGYYPMRVSMQVEYPANRMRFLDMKPQAVNPGVDNSKGLLELDVRFEGRLMTEISFQLKNQ